MLGRILQTQYKTRITLHLAASIRLIYNQTSDLIVTTRLPSNGSLLRTENFTWNTFAPQASTGTLGSQTCHTWEHYDEPEGVASRKIFELGKFSFTFWQAQVYRPSSLRSSADPYRATVQPARRRYGSPKTSFGCRGWHPQRGWGQAFDCCGAPGRSCGPAESTMI